MSPPRSRKCKACVEPFTPRNSMQVVCSPKCALDYARKEKLKEVRKEKREWKKANKPRKQLISEAQIEVNRYIRERDRFEGCISCHMPENYGGQWHAGHYRSTAAAPQLRFHEDNIHKQCAQCNSIKSSNAVEYRKGLIDKIGVERVEALECDNSSAKWTDEELIEIRKRYLVKRKVLQFQREKGASQA